MEELVHLAHLSNAIPDDGVQQAGKKMSQRWESTEFHEIRAYREKPMSVFWFQNAVAIKSYITNKTNTKDIFRGCLNKSGPGCLYCHKISIAPVLDR